MGTAALPLIAATTIGSLFKGTKRGSAMGTYQMLLSLAPAAAPILGGFIGERYNYPGIFGFDSIVCSFAFRQFVLLSAQPFGEKTNLSAGSLLSHYKDIFKTGRAMPFNIKLPYFFIYFQ
ncbi:MFS transporter [Bacillus licheniformis]|nr:MFS transporter [Bacillus licheniformis]